MRSLRPWLAATAAIVLAAPAAAQQNRGPSATPANGVLDAVLNGLELRSIGPANMMGRITDVEGIPSPSRTFYMASAAGGVWKTTNNGVTFRPLFQHERVASLGDLAIAPSDTQQVWVGTGEEDARNSISPGGGIYKSIDGGLTWRLMGLEKTEHIARIIVHPTDPNVIWVAAMGATWRTNPERGLYKSTDGGQTWQLKKSINDRTGFIDLAIHPRNPNVLFAASWERIRSPYSLQSGGSGSGLWRSQNGGETWTEVSGGGFPATTKGRIGIDISKSDPNIMYALVEAESPDGAAGGCRAAKAGGCGLYRSEDGGVTWTWKQPQNVRPFYYSQVRVDPADPNRVYWSSTPVNFSADGGTTVRTTTVGLHVDHHAMWIDPNDANRVIVGNDGGVGISFDRGGNWWFPNTIALGQFYNISHDMAVPYNVCGGLQDNGTWCGPTRRVNGPITNYMWATVSGGDGFVTAQDPRDPCIVYSESQGGNMGRSNVCEGERTGLQRPSWQIRYRMWADSIALLDPDPDVTPAGQVRARIEQLRRNQVRDSIDDQFRYNWNTPFFLSPHNPDVFYAAGNRVLKSTMRGDSLRPISPDLSKRDTVKLNVALRTTGGITLDVTGAETFGTVVSLNESPLRRGFLAAGTDDGNVWITTDDGGTWTDITGRFRGVVPDTSYVSRIEFSPHDAQRFYVTFDNHRRGDFTPYVFVTRDGGNTFRSIASNLPTGGPDFVHVVREDPVNPSLLYLGTDVGLYVSLDQGGSWQKWSQLPTTPVHDLRVHPRDRELIIGTHGRAIWIGDVAPLQQLTPQVIAAANVKLFDPSPALQFGGRPIGGESTGQAFFRGDSPAYGAQLTYYLPAAVEGPVRFVITDAAGDTVQTLNGPGRAGLQSVTWNMRARPSDDARPLTPSQRRDSLVTMRRVGPVADSLIAIGMDSAVVRRAAAMLRGEQPEAGPQQGAFNQPPQARQWQERPGEGNVGGSGGGNQSLNQVMQAFRAAGVPGVPGAQTGGFGGGQSAVVDPGTYNVTAHIGGQTLRTQLRVVK